MLAQSTLTVPPLLIEAAKQRRCILFVGSGLSIAASYPRWSDLVEQLTTAAKQTPAARVQGIEKIEGQADYLTLAEFARSTLGVSQYAAILRQMFDKPVELTPAHRLIAQTDYRGVITTNFDRLLETAITLERGWAPATFTSEQIAALASALYDSPFFIYKLHGDIGAAQTVILTDQDYDRLILRSPHVRSFLQAIFLNYTVLFVGYSLRDPDFNLMVRELNLIFQGYTPQHYALFPDPAEFMVDHLKRVINVQVIPYSRDEEYAPVTDFLRVVQEAAPYQGPARVKENGAASNAHEARTVSESSAGKEAS